MRTLNFTIKIEDNDFTEHKVRSFIEGNFGNAIASIKTFPSTDHLKENKRFKTLVKSKQQAQRNIDNFIDDNRLS